MEHLALNYHDEQVIRREAYALTAAIAPDLIPTLPALDDRMLRHYEFPLFQNMLNHGHIDAAYDLLVHFDGWAPFPHMAVNMVLRRCTDNEKKLILVRRAIQAWRDSLGGETKVVSPRRTLPARFDFLHTFSGNWTHLPKDEALTVLRELTATILRNEDRLVDARFDPEERVTFTSTRQYHLFELFDALRTLDPALADSLLETQSELAAAAAFFPFGMRSVNEAWAKRAAPAGASSKPASGSMGFGPRMPFANAMLEGKSSGQFAAAFDEAMKLYQRDVDSNASVRECWPSTQAFRSVLYSLGQSGNGDGSAYLERIPDPALRVYAQIEFAAALVGLPVYSGPGVSLRRPSAPS